MPVAAGLSTAPATWPDLLEKPPHPKKRLGQHFLINRGVLQKVLDAAALTPTDLVIEVGPGTGTLTRELVRRAGAVVAVELDRELAARLQRSMGAEPNLHLAQGDILALPPQQLLPLFPGIGPAPSAVPEYKVVANLPYYITAPVLRHFLASPSPPIRLVVMVQYEIAKRIVAKPGGMSILAIAVQFYGKPELMAQVAPGSFFPPPQVRSAILRIDPYLYPAVRVPSADAFFAVVKAGFSAPRKQLHNALAQAWDISTEEAIRLLAAAEVAPQRRAQSLSLEEWARIAWAWQEWAGRAPGGQETV